MNKRSKSLKK